MVNREDAARFYSRAAKADEWVRDLTDARLAELDLARMFREARDGLKAKGDAIEAAWREERANEHERMRKLERAQKAAAEAQRKELEDCMALPVLQAALEHETLLSDILAVTDALDIDRHVVSAAAGELGLVALKYGDGSTPTLWGRPREGWGWRTVGSASAPSLAEDEERAALERARADYASRLATR